MNVPKFSKEVVIYLPCYNCEDRIEQTLAKIPAELHSSIACLVVDNCSTDRTSEIVTDLIHQKKFPFDIKLVRTKENVQYPGSQKLAYSIALQSPEVKWVIMLHGDGQYPPSFLLEFKKHFSSGAGVVTSYRSKKVFPLEEETPPLTYFIISLLSLLESALTGFPRKEWHSGYVMYSTDFLRKIPLSGLSHTRHIDGEFLICAGILRQKVAQIAIYKCYKGFHAFVGKERLHYVLHVFGVIWKFRMGFYHRLLTDERPGKVATEFVST